MVSVRRSSRKCGPSLKANGIADTKAKALGKTSVASKTTVAKGKASTSKEITTTKRKVSITKTITAVKRKKAAAKTPTRAATRTSIKINSKEAAEPTMKATKASTETNAKASSKVLPKSTRKRKTDDDDDAARPPPPAKKARVTKQPKVSTKVAINYAPTQRLDVFVMGEGSNSELGLGTKKAAIDVKRPRLNPLLSAKDVGVVQVACGGMHAVALAHDGKIYTWGVNDLGALGRDTEWDGGMRDADDNKSEDSDDSDSGLNPKESTPTAIPADTFPAGTVITKICAGDSHTLALTDDGRVFGWGQYRKMDGEFGFYKTDNAENAITTQRTPYLYPELTKIVDICSGANHAMARDIKGNIFIWGCGEQNQLGYHVGERLGVHKFGSLKPRELRTRVKNWKAIYAGSDHSFAIDQHSRVWSWGNNAFGATGIPEGAGDDNAVVYTASIVKTLTLDNDRVIHLAGGNHHSIAITANGKALTWGRIDGQETGLDINTLPSTSTIKDEHGSSRIVIFPTAVPEISGAIWASAGSDHSIVVNKKGLAYAWGMSATYQLGLGVTDDVARPTHIDNTAVRGKMISWSGCGGQYSMLAAPNQAINGAANDNGEGPSAT